MEGERRPGHLRQRSGDGRPRAGSMERQWRRDTEKPLQGGYNGFKIAVAIIVFHFSVKLMVQFADLLLPFIMALLLVTVLEPVKQATLDILECTFILLCSKMPCHCCIRTTRKSANYRSPDNRTRVELIELGNLCKTILRFIAIVLTICFALRLFWLVGQIIWLSGEAVMHDLHFYEEGVKKRTNQVQNLLERFHLQKSVPTDMGHMGEYALNALKFGASFLSQHVFYTVTQVSLTAIFVLFLLWSPVQREFSPVMQGVFHSMETYLKLKTFISATMGLTNGVALFLIGLEIPAAWGLLTFLANFIPNIGGPVISIVPCLISVLDKRKTLYQVAAAFLAQFALHFNIANFIEPIIFGNTEEIHSVVVLLGLSFFGYIWGFTGMFLSVPLLFAMHAWLDTIAKRDSYGQEAMEDARFIMGILEGRWLATVDDTEGHPSAGVNLLTGHIEEDEHLAEREEEGATMGHATSQEAPQHGSSYRFQECFNTRDPETGEVLVLGLILKWIGIAGMYIILFFGFELFHWDLHVLIHPSGGKIFGANNTNGTLSSEVNVTAQSVPNSHADLVTTTVAMTMAQVMTIPPAFPFRGSPELEGADFHGEPGGSILSPHTTGAPKPEPDLHAVAPDVHPGPSGGASSRAEDSAGRTGRHGSHTVPPGADAAELAAAVKGLKLKTAGGNRSLPHSVGGSAEGGDETPHSDAGSAVEDPSTSQSDEELERSLET